MIFLSLCILHISNLQILDEPLYFLIMMVFIKLYSKFSDSILRFRDFLMLHFKYSQRKVKKLLFLYNNQIMGGLKYLFYISLIWVLNNCDVTDFTIMLL